MPIIFIRKGVKSNLLMAHTKSKPCYFMAWLVANYAKKGYTCKQKSTANRLGNASRAAGLDGCAIVKPVLASSVNKCLAEDICTLN